MWIGDVTTTAAPTTTAADTTTAGSTAASTTGNLKGAAHSPALTTGDITATNFTLQVTNDPVNTNTNTT